MKQLLRNMPGHPDWEGSFYEKLTEYGEWDQDAFWLLHLDLVEIAKSVKAAESVDRQLAHILLYLQQGVPNLIGAQFAENDVFKIVNLNDEKILDFNERFGIAMLGAVTGEVLPESSFALVNPHIAGGKY